MAVLSDIDTPELEPTNLIAEWELDWTIFKLKHSVWINQHELWKKFIRQ